MVQARNETEGTYNLEWADTLIRSNVFEGDPNQWRITSDNYPRVLQALELNHQQFEQALVLVIRKLGDQLPFADFCKLYRTELVKSATFELRAMDDTNLLETPA